MRSLSRHPLGAQAGESVETTLLAKPDDGGDRDPVADAEIVVYEAVIIDRVIESIGDEIGRGTSDATGLVSVALPGPGQYVVELNVDTLPPGVELVRADKQHTPGRSAGRRTVPCPVQPGRG